MGYENQQMPSMPEMQAPDLRTREGALQFICYHKPTEDQVAGHQQVNDRFQALLDLLWDYLPNGPGKTIFIRKLNEARMSGNSCIANNGA